MLFKKTWDCHAVQFTILFTPFIQATTSLKEAFGSAAKSTPELCANVHESDTSELAKKKQKLWVQFTMQQPAAIQEQLTKHYELLSKPIKLH